MKKGLFFLFAVLMASMAAAVSSYAGPAQTWGVLHSIHTTFSDGSEFQSERVENLKGSYGWAATTDHADWMGSDKAGADVNNLDDRY